MCIRCVLFVFVLNNILQAQIFRGDKGDSLREVASN